jgi:hypothetical protein
MRVPVDTAFFCYRAIEAIMQSMKAAPNAADALGWERLRSNLRVEADYLKAIKKHGDHPRHGRVSAISDAERAEVFRMTDPVLSRFLEYLVRGRQALEASEFLVLKAAVA